MALRRLAGSRKGSAFAFEMTLDTHRYGALIVLDRWSTLVAAFGPHLEIGRHPEIIASAGERVRAAEEIVGRANMLVDAAATYSPGGGSVRDGVSGPWTASSRKSARKRSNRASSAPCCLKSTQDARRIFLEDLAAR